MFFSRYISIVPMTPLPDYDEEEEEEEEEEEAREENNTGGAGGQLLEIHREKVLWPVPNPSTMPPMLPMGRGCSREW